MQQIFARIKKTSKYYYQHDPEQALFPVVVGTPQYEDYCVYGGRGGVYRKTDVELFIIDDAGVPIPLW